MKYRKIWMTALILALIIVLSGSVQAAAYADEKCGDNATWQIDDTGTLVISGTGAVTSAPWYDYFRYDFAKVVISEGITALSDQIFLHCSNLQQVTNETFEEYLKSLDREGLKNAMDAVYAQLGAST